MSTDSTLMAQAQAETEVAAQRARAMRPGVIRAAAYLHGAASWLPYHSAFTIAAEAERIRTDPVGFSQDGRVLRFLVGWPLGSDVAEGVLDILRNPPAPRPWTELWPGWAAMPLEARQAAWQQWRDTPAGERRRWVS